MVVVALASSRMGPVVKATWAALLIEATFEPMEAAFPTIMCWNTWPFIGTGKSYLRLATLCSITFFYSLFKEGFWLRGDFFFFITFNEVIYCSLLWEGKERDKSWSLERMDSRINLNSNSWRFNRLRTK